MAWWMNMTLLQQIFFCIALPTSILMVVQTIMVLVGMGADHDCSAGDAPDGPGDVGADSGISAFLFRGIIAFLTMSGWVGVGVGSTGLHAAWVVLIAFAAGALAFVGMAFLIKAILKLQGQGNIVLSNSIGKTGKVYIPIPPNKSGVGKISLNLQERFVELDAMTDEADKIGTDEVVTVVSMLDASTVIVSRGSQKSYCNYSEK